MRIAIVSLCLVACGGDDGGGGDHDGGGGGDSDRVARAAARIASCSLSSPTMTAAFAVATMNADDLDCALAAGDCEGLLACFGFRLTDAGCPAEDTCLDQGTLWTCPGVFDVPLEIDCAAWHGNGGPSCLADTAGGAACGTGTCGADGETCDGARLEDCEDGVLAVRDCADRGLTCTVASDSETLCADADSGAACAAEDHCDGDTLVRCEDGVETRVDCGAQYVDSTCVKQFGSSDVLCGYGSECEIDFGSPAETCEGSALTFCMVGRTVSVDCTAIGFDGCSTEAPGPGCR